MITFLFILACLIGFTAGIFMFIESFATLKFSSWSFTNGIIVIKKVIKLPRDIDKDVEIKALENCKIKIVSNNEVYFWSNVKRKFFSRNSAFAIKGIITKENDQWVMTGRLPISSTIFVLAFSVGWFCTSKGSASLLIGLGGILFILLSSVIQERYRTKTVINEIQSYFQPHT